MIRRPCGPDVLEMSVALTVIVGAAVVSHWISNPLSFILAMAVALTVSLSSHKRQLPSGESDLPLVAAVVFAFVVLFVTLLNDFRHTLWGFCEFLDQPPWAVWPSACLLTIACHAYSRRLARDLIDRLAARGPLPWPLFYGPPAVLFWVFRSYSISRDGFGCIAVARGDFGLEVVLREPLAYISFRVVYPVMALVGLDACDAVAVVSILSGLASLCALRRLWRLWRLDARQTALAWITTAATFGVTQMWFGHVEVYPPFCASVTWLFYLSSRALRERSALWPAGLAYGLAFAFHLAAIWLAPGIVALIVMAARGNEGRRLWRCLVAIALPFLLIHALLWGTIAAVAFDFDLAAFWERCRTVVTEPRTTPPFYRFSEMGAQYWLDRLQVVYVLCGAPVALLLLFLIPAQTRRGRRRPEVRTPQEKANGEVVVFLAALGGYMVYVVFWRPERMWFEDWDLFSALAPMVLILCVRVLVARELRRAFLGAAQIVLGLFLTLGALKVHCYHTQPTALTPYGNLTFPREGGHLLQEYYFTHPPDVRKHPCVRDGRVVVITEGESTENSPTP